MTENLLHFIWITRRFDLSSLQTTSGETIEILHPGEHNTHAGPDFLNAKIRIGDVLWAGNVEMHLKSSDWFHHGHGNDPAYDNVILHVVMTEDKPIVTVDQRKVPSFEMKGRIPAGIEAKYYELMAAKKWIPCEDQFAGVESLIKNLWYDRLLAERLERKCAAIQSVLKQNQNNWEETFYQFIARNFGLKINTQPFEMLARALPQSILARNRNNPANIDALLFGVAGFLDADFQDAFPNQLKKEFIILRQKYALSSLNPSIWKFLRLHPANFPTIRLAQFSALVQKSSHLFSQILETIDFKNLQNLLSVEAGTYWTNHFQFDKPSTPSPKALGKSTIQLITINTVAPFLYLYGKKHGEELFKEKALSLLESIPAEQNNITKGWKAIGEPVKSAAISQSLIHLKNEYCDRKRCLDCAVGARLVNV